MMKLIAAAALLIASAFAPARALAACTQKATGLNLCIPSFNDDGDVWGQDMVNAFGKLNDSAVANSSTSIGTISQLQVSTLTITENGISSAPYAAGYYPNAPIVVVVRANGAVQDVEQNLSTGTAATISRILTGSLGGNTSFYFEEFINSPNFNVAGYSAERSSATGIASSDSDLILEAGINGGLNGAASEKIIFVSSNPVAANIAGWLMEATASGPGAWVFASSGTFNGAGGLLVKYGITAASGTFTASGATPSVTGSSETLTGTAGPYDLTLSTGIFLSAGEVRFAAGGGGVVFPDGTRQATAASGGGAALGSNQTFTGNNTFTGQVHTSTGFSINFPTNLGFASTQSSFLPAASITGSTGSFTVQGTTVACWLTGEVLSTIQGDTAQIGIGMDGSVSVVPGTSKTVGLIAEPIYVASFAQNYSFYVEFQVTGGGASHYFWLGLWNNGGTSTFPSNPGFAQWGCREVTSR